MLFIIVVLLITLFIMVIFRELFILRGATTLIVQRNYLLFYRWWFWWLGPIICWVLVLVGNMCVLRHYYISKFSTVITIWASTPAHRIFYFWHEKWKWVLWVLFHILYSIFLFPKVLCLWILYYIFIIFIQIW